MNLCKTCKHSSMGQFGMFCMSNEASRLVNPVTGDTSLMFGDLVAALDLRQAQFNACGPTGKLWVPIIMVKDMTTSVKSCEKCGHSNEED